jgi:threonine synthase
MFNQSLPRENLKNSLTDYIDDNTPAERSLLLRYHPVILEQGQSLPVSREDLAASSIAEGACLYPLAHYMGVDIWVCDESSLMATGTYKDLDACLITAIAKHTGLQSIVLSSGGNLGYAMARYAAKAGLQVYFFHPKSTLYKLDAGNFTWDGVKIITVDRPEKEVKLLARSFAEAYGLTHVPALEWRFTASAVRALHIAEKIFLPGIDVHWLAQTLCAGFGPVGVYQCWSRLIQKGILRPEAIPHFLGVQQAANAPIVEAWQAGDSEIAEYSPGRNYLGSYIEPGLYNTNPSANYANLINLLKQFGGSFLSVDLLDYHKHEGTVIGWFRDVGLEFTARPDTGEILERAGILTGVGIMKAIENRVVEPGTRVLYLLTGGFRKIPTFEPLRAGIMVDDTRTIAGWVQDLGKEFSLA